MKHLFFFSFAIIFACNLSAQVIYIRYDNLVMDKLEYKYVEPNATTTAIYSSYRLTNEPGALVFLQAGIENVKIVDNAFINPVDVRSVRLDANYIKQINEGKTTLFLCRPYNNQWALLQIGSVERFVNTSGNISVLGPDMDFNINTLSQQSGDHVSTRYANEESVKCYVFYLGKTQACNTTAYHVKKSPSQTCLDESELLILPALGVIRNQTPDGKIFELTNVNGKDVCSYLASGSTVASVPNTNGVTVNNIPSDYSTISVRSKNTDDLPVVQDNNVSSSEYYNTMTGGSANLLTNNPCDLVAEDDEHIVIQGENLLSIARQHGITLAELKKWNGMTSNVIRPCMTLKIAPQETDITAADNMRDASTMPTDYNIQVTKKIPIYVEQPTESNNVSDNSQNIPPDNTPDCTTIAGEGEHVVQRGESLFGIARIYGITDKQLLVWNKMSGSKIYPCSVLKVSVPATSYASVVPMSYNTKVRVKSLAPTKKSTKTKTVPQFDGQSVRVKEGVYISSKNGYVKRGTGLHVVQKNETVSLLAKRFELKETYFRELNGLDKTEKLSEGQVVRIQKSCICDITDVPTITAKSVMPQSYAGVYMRSKSVNAENHSIAAENDGENNVAVTQHKYHVVTDNETLYSISKKYSVSVEQLMALNKLEPNEIIIPNQTLILK